MFTLSDVLAASLTESVPIWGPQAVFLSGLEPPKRGKPLAGFNRDHINSKYTASEKSNSSFYFLSVCSGNGENGVIRDEQTAP